MVGSVHFYRFVDPRGARVIVALVMIPLPKSLSGTNFCFAISSPISNITLSTITSRFNHRLSSVSRFNNVLNRFNTFPVSITQYRRGCVLQQHCCPIQISVKS